MPPALLQRLERHATDHPDRVAVCEISARGDAGASLTYRTLHERSVLLQQQIREQVPRGGIVILQCPNTVEFVVAFVAVLAAECSVLPVSCDSPPAEFQAITDRAGAAGVIQAGLGVVAGAVDTPRILRGPSLLLLSSGTTGRPKIVVRDGDSIDAVSQAMCQSIGFTRADRVLTTLPLCHSYGLEHGLLAPVWAGCSVHLMRSFELPGVMSQLCDGGITLFPSVPSVYEMIAQLGDAAARFTSLRTSYSAGAPLPLGVSDALMHKFSLRVGQLYGATEVGSVTFNDPQRADFDPASVGQPMNGVSIRILDCDEGAADLPRGEDGQVAIRAASMFSGYLDESACVPDDSFFRTGDLGHLALSGDLNLSGRIKLLIDVGGLKVNPLEVEAALAEHEQVGSCVVVPVQLSSTVFRLKAVLTPRDPALPPSPADLRAFLRRQLSPYKVPRIFELRSVLPRTATGKILRHLVNT